MDWIVPEAALVPPLQYMLLTATATLLVGLSKGGFGGGIGIVATPMFLMALPGNVALSMILPLLIVCDAFTLRHFPRDWHPRSFKLIAGGTVIGLGLGLYLLLVFAREDVDGDRWIRLVVSLTAIAFVGLKLWRVLARRPERIFRPNAVVGTFTGILCGITTMLAHAAGLLVNMFLLSQRLDQRRFVGTCARYYLTFNTAKIPLYMLATLWSDAEYLTFGTLKWDLWLLPFCPIGVALGAWLNRRMSGRVFTFIIYAFLAVTAGRMLFGVLQASTAP